MKACAFGAVLVCLCTLAPRLSAQGSAVGSLRTKQEAQQRARDLAKDLVTGILDTQLRQLEENGLAGLDLYCDIRTMRDNINGLVEAEMQRVIDLLVEAEQRRDSERQEILSEARRTVRVIVVRLALERQNLGRRLKAADLAAQVKRVLAVESSTLSVTSRLAFEPERRRDAAALEAVHGQRDVRALYGRLVESLNEVREWGGAVGTGAAEGIVLLESARVGQAVDDAVRHLEASSFELAVDSEKAVLHGLRLLLARIEAAQGLIAGDAEAKLQVLRTLRERQEELQASTERSDLGDDDIEGLVDAQSAVREDLARFAEDFDMPPAAPPLIERALQSAAAASSELFAGRKEAALDLQEEVVEGLKALEGLGEKRAAARAQTEDRRLRAADQKELLVDMDRLRSDLLRVRGEQARVVRDAEADPAGAASVEDAVARALAALLRERPAAARSAPSLPRAEEAARLAASELEDRSAGDEPGSMTEQASELAGEVGAALDAAIGELDAGRNGVERQARALEAGEMSGAAEALERAVGSEREIEAEARAAAQAGGLAPERAAALSQAQSQVQSAARSAEGAAQALSPRAAEALSSASGPLAEVGDALRPAQAGASGVSSAAADRLSSAAAAAAAGLARAASALRADAMARTEEMSAPASDTGLPSPAGSAAAAANGGGSRGRAPSQNQSRKDGPRTSERSDVGLDSRTPDAPGGREASARRLDEAPWFSRLPPELREAMRSGSRRRAPPAYEERLRRYFESLD